MVSGRLATAMRNCAPPDKFFHAADGRILTVSAEKSVAERIAQTATAEIFPRWAIPSCPLSRRFGGRGLG